MNDTFHCGDHEALVAFLYDECEARDREAIGAHLSHCAACAGELEALRATRSVLASWTPPSAALGFRVTRADERPPAAGGGTAGGTVLRPAAWWRQPLPAWAQVAAAALIFAAGLSLGAARGGAGPEPARQASVPAPVRVAPAAAAATAQDLARVERRLQAIETARERQASSTPATMRTVSAPASAEQEAWLRRVEALIAESEARQRADTLAVANAVIKLDEQRRYDLRTMGTTVNEVRELGDSLLRVSFQQPMGGR